MTTIKNKKHTYLLTKRKCAIYTVLFVLVSITIYGIIMLTHDDIRFADAGSAFLHYFRIMFLQPKMSYRIQWLDFFQALGSSLALALLTTIIGTVFAFIFALGAAENLAPKSLCRIIRIITALVRSVPTIIWVLVFSVSVNIGTDAAVLGMIFHSVAYLVKGFSESFEQIDRRTIDALRACGAGFVSIITQAVLPVSAKAIISWFFFRFEINFVNAVAIGAAAGAGGIGYHLFMAGSLYFDIHELGFLTYAIFFVALCLEVFSIQLRKKIKAA